MLPILIYVPEEKLTWKMYRGATISPICHILVLLKCTRWQRSTQTLLYDRGWHLNDSMNGLNKTSSVTTAWKYGICQALHIKGKTGFYANHFLVFAYKFNTLFSLLLH